jgi:hypothetical protein
MNSPSFPPSCPNLERRARSSADAWRSVNGGSYGDSKSLRRPAPPLPPSPMPSVRPDPANPGSLQCVDRRLPYLSARQQDPAGRSVGGTAILTGLPDPRNRLAPSSASVARRPSIAGTNSLRRHGIHGGCTEGSGRVSMANLLQGIDRGDGMNSSAPFEARGEERTSADSADGSNLSSRTRCRRIRW